MYGGHMCVPHSTCRGQRTTHRIDFFHPTVVNRGQTEVGLAVVSLSAVALH